MEKLGTISLNIQILFKYYLHRELQSRFEINSIYCFYSRDYSDKKNIWITLDFTIPTCVIHVPMYKLYILKFFFIVSSNMSEKVIEMESVLAHLCEWVFWVIFRLKALVNRLVKFQIYGSWVSLIGNWK